MNINLQDEGLNTAIADHVGKAVDEGLLFKAFG